MYHIDLMDGKITKQEMFRRLSCMSHCPGNRFLKIYIKILDKFSCQVKSLRRLFKSINVNMKLFFISLFSIWYGLCSHEIKSMTN